MDKINKVAIFGMGKSGKAAVTLAKKLNLEIYAVNKGDVDLWYETEAMQPLLERCYCFSEEDFSQYFHKMDQIILSPGIPLSHPALALARASGVPIISEIEFAYRQTKHIPVIAITGTNGKTTTTTMIAECLKLSGFKVFCGGNIGIPYSELAISEEKVDYAVIEVSSFQLETIDQFHPKIGLFLNLFPNHSERYNNLEDYGRAKFNMLKNMNGEDHMILGQENPFLHLIDGHPVKKSFFQKGDLPLSFKQKFNFDLARVKGEHNEANFYATYKVLEILDVTNRDKLFQQFIEQFSGVAHRLEYVLTYHGLEIYNDAKSTNALATTTAIRAFANSPDPLYLILGGKLRNQADKILPDLLVYKDQIKRIFTIGEVSERLRHELQDDFFVTQAGDLKAVFEIVRREKLQGHLVFSPAFPSFDQFANYVDRGEKFKAWARDILRD
jgi:UDP-N-acetylmuramoylalanine--D-glutamate ligase